MYEVTVHFTDGRETASFAADEFDIPPEARDQEGGLRRYAYVAPGGGRATVCLNPGEVAAIVPALVEPDRGRELRTPQRPANSARPAGGQQPGGGQRSESDKNSRYPRSWPEPTMAHLQWGRFPRSIDLEGEILTFLARFEVATPRQLMR